jgi:ABC-type spermidine/putrescine transport system permease subunit II
MAPPEALLNTAAVAGVMVVVGLLVGGFLAIALYRGGRD